MKGIRSLESGEKTGDRFEPRGSGVMTVSKMTSFLKSFLMYDLTYAK
jgi:hypothetical protein